MSRKIIGITVGTPMSPEIIKKERIYFTDDGNGNVTLSAQNGTINLVDDGEGNVILGVI